MKPLLILTILLTISLPLAAQTNAKAKPAPAYAASVPKPTFSEVRSGTHERHILDFWKAESPTPTPVAFVIHGDGEQGGESRSRHWPRCMRLPFGR